MSKEAEQLVKDAEEYVSNAGVRISPEAVAIIRDAEHLAWSVNSYVYDWTYHAVLLRRVKPVRAALARLGADPDFAAEAFDRYTRTTAESSQTAAPYDIESTYSSPYRGNRQSSTRSRLIDLVIDIAKREGGEITGLLIFEALLAYHDEVNPFISNGDYSDQRLHTPYNTLAHLLGRYEPSLFVKLVDLRNELGFRYDDKSDDHPADVAPPAVRSAVLAFLVDHPDYRKNCFLVMPFAETKLHKKIAVTLKIVMQSHGFNLVRADENVYSEDLLTNIQAHIYGCRFAVAVFERILTNDFNPNVSLEVGYFLGLRRPVCLLKERTLPRLPSDLVGRLYVEFDGQRLESSLRGAVERWLRERGLIPRPGFEISPA